MLSSDLRMATRGLSFFSDSREVRWRFAVLKQNNPSLERHKGTSLFKLFDVKDVKIPVMSMFTGVLRVLFRYYKSC
jgi:hypothetical protein